MAELYVNICIFVAKQGWGSLIKTLFLLYHKQSLSYYNGRGNCCFELEFPCIQFFYIAVILYVTILLLL